MSTTTIYIQVTNPQQVAAVRSYLNEKFNVISCFSKNEGREFKEGLYCYVTMHKQDDMFHVSYLRCIATEVPVGSNVYKFINLSTIDESVFDDRYSKINLGSQVDIAHNKYTVCLNGRSRKFGLWNESVLSFFEDKSITIEDYRLELKEKYGRYLKVIKH